MDLFTISRHLRRSSVPGLVQESSSQMQTTIATTAATAAATATTDSSVEGFAQIESES